MNYVLVDIREVHKKRVLATAAPLRATAQDLPTTATHTPLRATVQDLPTATPTPLSTATAGECLPHERPIPKPRASVGDSISHGWMNNVRVVAAAKVEPTEYSGEGELPLAKSSAATVMLSAVKSKSTRAATVHSPATSYQQAPQRPGFVQPSSAGLLRGAGLTLSSAAQCQVKSEQATAAPAIPHPPTLSFVSSSLVAPAQQPLSSSGLFGATPLTGLKLSSAQPSRTLNLGTPFFGAASTIPHITPVFPDPRVEPPGRAVAIDDQSVPQFVAHSMLGVPLRLGSVGVSQATTAAAPVQVQPAEVAPPTPIGFKIVNVVVKSSIQ